MNTLLLLLTLSFPLQDSRAAADLEKVNKEKEKLLGQVEALKKAAHVS